MPSLAAVLALLAGLAVAGCGAAPPPVAAPSVADDEDAAAPASDQGDAPSAPREAHAAAAAAAADPVPSSPPAAPPDSPTGAAASSDESLVQDEPGAGECRESDAKLKLRIDRRQVNIEEGRLQAEMDGPICLITMKMTLVDGSTTVEKAFRYAGPQREMRWDPVPRDEIERIEFRVTGDTGGYESVILIPWSVRIDHQEVEFDTDKAVIRPSETPSLEDSYAKIGAVLARVQGKEFGKVTLFIAGHTDTRGSDGHNLVLSRERARAIATWFMKRGLCVPIAYEGFGETALKKLTADEVDEQANRRVDYILAVEPPVVIQGRNTGWTWLTQGC
jgi:outer membrane protein OmpA-like peptidoglycan-associated protein